MKTKLLLTSQKIHAAQQMAAPYRLWDTRVPGLFVRVQPTGVKTFNVQWSRASSKAIGKFPGQTLDGARTKALAILSDAAVNGTPQAAAPKAEIVTFGDFITKRYAPWVEAERKAGKVTVANIKAQFDSLYPKPLGEVSAWLVEKFKAARLKAGIKPATVNRDLDRIRAALSKAVEWKLLGANPLASVKRSKGGSDTRVRYLTPVEEKRLRKALEARESASKARRLSGNQWNAERGREGRREWTATEFTDHLYPLTLVALNTGLRRGELFGLEWSDVNLPGKQITVRGVTAKSGKTRHLPLNAEALDVLKRWRKQGGGSGLVFPGAGGGRMTNINKSWAGLVKDAALTDFRFHDCRHHFASRLVMAGVDLYTVKELLGHSDFAMTQRYAHLSPGHKAAAVEKLIRP